MISYRYDAVRRVEPEGLLTDLGRGFAAEVADPAWMLGRQWQLGEHQGEDAASPIRVTFRREIRPVEVAGGGDAGAPGTPPEAAVESEPEQWWTLGRRIRIGQIVARAAGDLAEKLREQPELRLGDLPSPYDALSGGLDGRALWRQAERFGLQPEWFTPRPPATDAEDAWDPAELAYDAELRAGDIDLPLRRHHGGRLDWYHVDAIAPEVADTTGAWIVERSVLCSRLRYPGAPTARWWEIEDAAHDTGGQAPDRSHFATLLLADLLAGHSDDWFTFPIEAPGGSMVTVDEVVVHDAFGDQWRPEPPSDGWSLFRVSGLEAGSLLVWPTASVPLVGPLLDEVALGVDEDANVLWAVEHRADGRELATPAEELERPERLDGADVTRQTYRPALPAPRHWHPYVIREVEDGAGRTHRRFVQGRLSDASGDEAAYTPEAVVDLLYDRMAGNGDPVHQIEPSTIPVDGLRLERRYVLARRTDGHPVLWSERRRRPSSAPPGFVPRFDVITPGEAADD